MWTQGCVLQTANSYRISDLCAGKYLSEPPVRPRTRSKVRLRPPSICIHDVDRLIWSRFYIFMTPSCLISSRRSASELGALSRDSFLSEKASKFADIFATANFSPPDISKLYPFAHRPEHRRSFLRSFLLVLVSSENNRMRRRDLCDDFFSVELKKVTKNGASHGAENCGRRPFQIRLNASRLSLSLPLRIKRRSPLSLPPRHFSSALLCLFSLMRRWNFRSALLRFAVSPSRPPSSAPSTLLRITHLDARNARA